MLLVFYNGRAAVGAGMCAALLGMTLFGLGLLPGYPKVFPVERATYVFGPWGLVAGCLGTLLVLLLWQPGSKSQVFLDRICIHQRDQKLNPGHWRNFEAFGKHAGPV